MHCQWYSYLLFPAGELPSSCTTFTEKLVMLFIQTIILFKCYACMKVLNVYNLLGVDSINRVMCLIPLITWLEDIISLKHLSHMFTWIIIVEVIGNLYRFECLKPSQK